MLIFLLGHEDINVQVAAAQGIGVMALNVASCESIGQWGKRQLPARKKLRCSSCVNQLVIFFFLFLLFPSSDHLPVPFQPPFLDFQFFAIFPTFVVPLIISFLILSSFVTPHIHRSIRISATSDYFSCALFSANVTAPYTCAGLTTVHQLLTFIVPIFVIPVLSVTVLLLPAVTHIHLSSIG